MKKNTLKLFTVLVYITLLTSCTSFLREKGSFGGQIGNEKTKFLKQNKYSKETPLYDKKIEEKLLGKDSVSINNKGLEFNSKLTETKELNEIFNAGNLYFVEESKEPNTYTLNIYKKLINQGNIYVIDGFKGSTLKINANYEGGGNINLGLYVDEEAKILRTDKVYIDGDVSGDTWIKFIYNEEKVKKFKNLEPAKEDFVIKVRGKATENSFGTNYDEGYFPLGPEVYELKYSEVKAAENTNEIDIHTWKLEKKN